MKILLLSAYLFSLPLYQQDNTLLSKKADKTNAPTDDRSKKQVKDSPLNTTQKNPDQKEKPAATKAKPGPLNKPAQ